MTNKKEPLGKGLIGHSGFVVHGIHISSNYSNNGMIFVDEDGRGLWERKPLEEVIDKSKIISCCQCERPAITLDHFYPYHIEMNLCEEHGGKA